MKNILFLVTGMTPQIITETVYGLAIPQADSQDEVQSEIWIPDGIHVLSTQKGLDQIRSKIIKDGKLTELCNEYGLPNIKLDESCLRCIQDSEGNELNDLRTQDDNENAANLICEIIREFTTGEDSEDTCMHVSIAGGRKTMGFYAGYALSLYGRYQDRMSHVLVNENYEMAKDFFYPAKEAGKSYATNYKDEKLDTYKAKVWLADIPFVRLRNPLSKQSQIADLDFATIVANINRAMKEVSVKLNKNTKSIMIDDVVLDNLAEREYAFFATFIIDASEKGQGFKRPKKNKVIDDKFLAIILKIYDGTTPPNYFTHSWFSETMSVLKKNLIDRLGLDMAEKIIPKQEKREGTYSININVKNIEIISKI